MNKIAFAVNRLKDSKGIVKLLVLIVGAFLFALPFIVEELWLFGWIGLSFLFVIIMDFQKTSRRVFGSLFCFFFLFYVFAYSGFVSMYPLDFAGLGTIESIGVFVCAVVLIPIIHGTLMTVSVFLSFLAAKKTDNIYLRAVLVSFGYVLGEFLQSVGTFAFPWAMLFAGQSSRIEILQSASLFGARFVTFIIVFVNALLALLLLNIGKNKRTCKMLGILALSVFVLNFVFGAVRVAVSDYGNSKKITAVAFQGNIPSSEKWKPGRKPATDVYYNLALEAKEYCDEKGMNVDVAAIPETAFPYTIDPKNTDGEASQVSMKMAELLSADVFVGAFSEDGDASYNSLFVYCSDGVSDKTYDKRNLVPFGEFLPYRSILTSIMPSLGEINMLSHDLSRGKKPAPLETSAGKAACLICFDSIFPENARVQVKDGADYIVISTNDSWYKQSRALYQHSSHAVMRAVENNRSVLRSANTGISMIIDPVGRVKQKTVVDERTFIVDEMPIETGKTLYTLTGDLVAPVGILLVFGMLVLDFIKKKILPR